MKLIATGAAAVFVCLCLMQSVHADECSEVTPAFTSAGTFTSASTFSASGTGTSASENFTANNAEMQRWQQQKAGVDLQRLAQLQPAYQKAVDAEEHGGTVDYNAIEAYYAAEGEQLQPPHPR